MSQKTHQRQIARARAKRRALEDRRRKRTRVIASVVVALLALSLFGVALSARDGDPTAAIEDEPGQAASPTQASGSESLAAECPPPGNDVPEPTSQPYDAPPEMTIDPSADHLATIRTTCGDIVLDLAADRAPTTVNNFVSLARDGYYEGVPFHRVMDGFMIQGGDPTGTGSGCLDEDCSERLPGYTFEDELGLAEELVERAGGYPRGTLAMANAGPDTNGSQFFIVQGRLVDGERQPAPLAPDYTAFGAVVSGMEVVDTIAGEPVEGQLAVDPVRILSVDIEERPSEADPSPTAS